MANPLDFKSISTWKNLDLETACFRLSSMDGIQGFNPGAITVSATVFNQIKDNGERAKFFFNCENLGLRHWKLHYAFKYFCHEDLNNLIQCVLKSDEAMMENIREEEITYKS